MPTTTNLKLPLIAPAQAQKHVTHNEALTALDALIFLAVSSRRRTSPPAAPADGERHLIAAAATGVWLGRDKSLAVFLDGGWRYYAPQAGWMARILDEQIVLSFDGIDWVDLVNASGVSSLQNLVSLGVGTTADAINELSFKGNNLLVSAKSSSEGGTGDVRAKINKQAAANIGSLLFQDNYAGRAELGLIGDDDFVLKLSADGINWIDALRARPDGGQISVTNPTADTHALNRISADGRYLGLTPQNLSAAQQAQARANIGVQSLLAPWESANGTAFSTGGVIGANTVTMRYLLIGKTIVFSLQIVMTQTGGSGLLGYVPPIPPRPGASQVAVGRENAITGKSLTGFAANTALYIHATDYSYLGIAGYEIALSGVYEVA